MTSEHTIKFTHSENGEINTCKGSTVFANLLMLGALANTRKYDSTLLCMSYATDKAGLESLVLKTNETVSELSRAMTALGVVLGNIDLDMIDQSTVRSLGWLITGLGELLEQVSFEEGDMSCNLRAMQVNGGKVQS